MSKPKTPPPAPATPAPGATPPAAPAPAAGTPTSAPAAATAPPAIQPTTVKETDPVELQVLKSQLPDGRFNLFVRVLNIADKGLGKKTVVFICEGDQRQAVTDKQGDANCPFNPLTAPANGKELRISAHVSGIRDLSVTHIIQRVVRTPVQIARDTRNNKRAKYFLLAAAVLWLICLFIIIPVFGLGKPLIDLDLPQTTLTKQQQVDYNALSGVKGTILEIQEIKPDPTPPTGQWQKPFLLFVLLWSGFSIFYGILSCREEVMEAFRHGMEKLVDKHYNSSRARDPLFQRLLAFSGHLRTTRRPGTAAPTTTDATPDASSGTPQPGTPTGKNTFWELFRSDLLSDFVTEVLPGILKAVFKR